MRSQFQFLAPEPIADIFAEVSIPLPDLEAEVLVDGAGNGLFITVTISSGWPLAGSDGAGIIGLGGAMFSGGASTGTRSITTYLPETFCLYRCRQTVHQKQIGLGICHVGVFNRVVISSCCTAFDINNSVY